MKKAKTPSFTTEFEVKASSKERRVLRVRLEAGRQLYNAILVESLRRLHLMHQDPDYLTANAMPRGASGPQATVLQASQMRARRAAFATLREKHLFREYDLHMHSSLKKTCWLMGHVDSQVAQKVATLAFNAVEQFAFGRCGKPRSKDPGEIRSLEGKRNASGLRYRSGRIVWNGEFARLDLPLMVKPGDVVHAHALRLADEGHVKFVRILTRTIRGRERVFVQLVLEGQPWVKLGADGTPKHPVAQGVRGAMDLGPSQVVVVSQGHVQRFHFCADLDRKQVEIRKFQRRIERQRRAKNSFNYESDGTLRKGPKPPDKSNTRKRAEAHLADLHRSMAAHRTSLQNHLAHQVLALANVLVTEKVNKRDWAGRFGRSIGHKAPAKFEDQVGILAKASGGGLELVCTYRTYLSSRCLCGRRKKKMLNERKHTCGCTWFPNGTYADRDEFSAFLAMFCQGSALDEGRARAAWSQWGVDSLLRSSSMKSEVAIGKAQPTHCAREARQSDSTKSRSGQRRDDGPSGSDSAEGSTPSKT